MNTVTINPSAKTPPWYKRWFVRIMIIAIATTIFWLAGVPNLIYQWSHQKSSPKHIDPPSLAHTLTAPTAAVGVAPPAPKGNDSSISKVPLPLLLTGTMPGRDAHEGRAFIGVDKDSPQTYAAGALLANGARIASIYTDHVVLERNGKSVELYLQGVGHSHHTNINSSLLTVGGVTAPTPATANTHEVLTDYIRPSPVYDAEVLKGFQVYAGQHATVFSQLGLESGDIITSINGVPLNEPASAIEQLKQLTQGVAVTATLKRKGQTQTISIDGSLITKDQNQLKNPQPVTAMPGM